ncbi:Ger(x)C family spore germination C-terminal domain-containing protein [Neobacillus drentensis]|uniref:Ger(x)C family spore germination C-terminal domain-containing protein n=1 Tax=Neobacillus drentensis TaxID=220684 RepID=UPI003001BF0F
MNLPQDFKKELNIKKLNEDLSDELTKQAKEVTNTLLKANCDVLGIGRRISSFHPELWKKINWEKEYKNVQFEPKVKVNIIKTGNVF